MEGIVRSLNPTPDFMYQNGQDSPAVWTIFYKLFMHMKYGQGGKIWPKPPHSLAFYVKLFLINSFKINKSNTSFVKTCSVCWLNLVSGPKL